MRPTLSITRCNRSASSRPTPIGDVIAAMAIAREEGVAVLPRGAVRRVRR